MIGRIEGRLCEKHPPSLVVDVNGVGYELEAPMTTFYDLPEAGAAVALHTHLVVREDAQQLFGFLRRGDRDLFRQLIKISGVGAKLALAILSGLSASELATCIQAGDTARLSRLPGIGKKTAERLVIELRDRLVPGTAEQAVPAGQPAPAVAQDCVTEAVSALVALGLKPPEASRRVLAVEGEDLAVEEIVRRALKSMVK
ncbi:MAG: Holliday junction branch migration protein RuvA [Gammaproteobacteria bacterium]